MQDVIQDDGTYAFSSDLATADMQERAINAPAQAFMDQLTSYGFDAVTVTDLVNKDLAGYNFYTEYPRPTRWQPALAKYIPAFYGGAGFAQWSNLEPILFIDPFTGIISPNQPTEDIITGAGAAGPWEFHIGPPGTCYLVVAPAWDDYVDQGLIAKLDATDTWVQRHRVFDQPLGTGRALQGNKWPGWIAAYSMMNQAEAVIFNTYGDADATLLGMTPVNPNIPKTISPQDYSAVPYSGDPKDFPAYVIQVCTEIVDRQYACAFLGMAMVQAAIKSGTLFGLYDMLSPAPIDPATKVRLLGGAYGHPMGHFPTFLQTMWGRMLKGDRPFLLKGDPNSQTATGQDYKGIQNVESGIGVDTEFVDRVIEELVGRWAAYAALDRNHQVIITTDIDGSGNMGSKFGAALKSWPYPHLVGPNPDWNLQNALDTGVTTKQELYNLADNGPFADPALQDELIDHPVPAAYNAFLQYPNGQLILNARLRKL